MKRTRLSELITGYAIKRLTSHEVDASVSNGHEFQGVNSLKEILGTERKSNIPCTFVHLPTDGDLPFESVDASVSWYDSRENNPNRSAEWRLYYDKRAGGLVQSAARAGDLFALARLQDGRLVVFLVAQGSSSESQLLYLLSGKKPEGIGFEVGIPDNRAVGFAETMILASIGIDAPATEATEAEPICDDLFREYSGTFPATAEFSRRARETFVGPDLRDDPDGYLVGIMEWETILFRLFEERLLSIRLEAGFGSRQDGYDVEGFIKVARSIGNRRFARAGLAFEHHVRAILVANDMAFEWHARTEGKRTPDFLFPSGTHYRDPAFSPELLRMLGTKTSCKDRWRQVINEAARVSTKHLLTLEPAISEDQTTEMREERVQLVVPTAVQATYTAAQRNWLKSLSDFLSEAKALQGQLYT
jgi:hypothetical protein